MFEEFRKQFLTLNDDNKKALIKELSLTFYENDHTDRALNNCPRCKSDQISKYGKYNGAQRYKCSSCNRTFISSTGTAIGMIKKKREFLACQDLMLTDNYMSLVKTAEKLGVSAPTVFSWRHKILLSMPKTDAKFEGDSEMDDLWVLYSQKGRKGLEYSRKRGGSKRKGDNGFQVKVLAVANNEQVELKVTNIGRISQTDIQRTVGDRFAKNATLYSDKHQSIAAFAKTTKIKHVSFTASEHTVDGKGVQHVNNIAERLKSMVNRTFRGVSTKYLQLYADWFKTKENFKDTIEDRSIFQKAMFSNHKSWDVYSNVENIYERFIKNHSARTYRCPVKNRYKSVNWNGAVITDFAYI